MPRRRNTIEIIINAKDQASATLKSIGGNVQNVGKLALAGLGGLAAGAAAAGVGIAKLAIDAAPLVAIEEAFTGLAEAAGIGSEEMIQALREGSRGMIAQRDLMLTFNKAAQLVSTDFAKDLPEAMGFLGKVSAATGQDLDFLLDSLVTGVGRLSPMILDNLAIQVDLNAAYEAYAEELGKSTDELTKQEQQAALMNQVMEKLAENTEAMPDLAGSATAGLAQMEATFKDVKDELGKALIPALSTVLETFSDLASRILPLVTNFFETTLAPILEVAAELFGELVDRIMEGESPVAVLVDLMSRFLPPELIAGIESFIAGVESIIEAAKPYLEMAVSWVAQHVELQDVLIALGAVILSVLVPAVVSLVTSLSPIILTIGAVVGAVVLLRKIWEEDFLGIRTALTSFWEDTGKPIFETLVEWLQTNIPVAIEILKGFWEDTLKPALEVIWAFILENIVPAFETLVLWLAENIPVAIEALKGFWEETLKPALEVVWTFIQENLLPVFETVVLWLAENIPVAIQELSDLWENLLKPALEIVWAFLSENVVPLFEALVELFNVGLTTAITALAGLWENTLKPALETVWQFIKDNVQPILDGLKSTFDSIGDAIGTVIGWITDLTDKLRNIQLPDWLNPGSPTPFETGLRGIASAMRDISMYELPRLEASLEMAAAGSQRGSQQTSNYNLTVNTNTPLSNVRQDFQTMRAMA